MAVDILAIMRATNALLRKMVNDRSLSGDPDSCSELHRLPNSKTAHSGIWINIPPELKDVTRSLNLPPEMLAVFMRLNDRRGDE